MCKAKEVCAYKLTLQAVPGCFRLTDGIGGGAIDPLSSTHKCRQKNGKSSEDKTNATLMSIKTRLRHLYTKVTAGTRTECPDEIRNGMPNGTETCRNFQILGKKDNLQRLTKILETNFSKISVPFDSVPEFPEILVQWIAPTVSFPTLLKNFRDERLGRIHTRSRKKRDVYFLMGISETPTLKKECFMSSN